MCENMYDQYKSHEILRINENMEKCPVEKKKEEEQRKSPFLNTKACVTGSVCDG